MKNIGVVTGTRAEYGLLRPLIKKIDAAGGLNLTLIVTGMHLSPEFGLTYREIEADGFKIDKRIEMLLSSDTPGGVLKSMGLELIAFADYLAEKNIDMIVLLGIDMKALWQLPRLFFSGYRLHTFMVVRVRKAR